MGFSQNSQPAGRWQDRLWRLLEVELFVPWRTERFFFGGFPKVYVGLGGPKRRLENIRGLSLKATVIICFVVDFQKKQGKHEAVRNQVADFSRWVEEAILWLFCCIIWRGVQGRPILLGWVHVGYTSHPRCNRHRQDDITYLVGNLELNLHLPLGILCVGDCVEGRSKSIILVCSSFRIGRSILRDQTFWTTPV